MSKARKVDFGPTDFLEGTAGMSNELVGAYWRLCALTYARNDGVPYDNHPKVMEKLKTVLACDPRTVRRLVQALKDRGKILEVEAKLWPVFMIENDGDSIEQKLAVHIATVTPRLSWSGRFVQNIKRAFHHRCFYCGDEYGPFEIDHLHPRSRGGGDDLENLVLACRDCNRKKGDLTVQEWRRPHG